MCRNYTGPNNSVKLCASLCVTLWLNSPKRYNFNSNSIPITDHSTSITSCSLIPKKAIHDTYNNSIHRVLLSGKAQPYSSKACLLLHKLI